MPRNFPKRNARGGQDWEALIRAHSPYLAGMMDGGAPDDPEAAFEALLEPIDDGADPWRELRLRKRRAAYLIAVADIRGIWDDMTAMRQLSRFADFCVQAALRHLLVEAVEAGKLKKPRGKKDIADSCGITVQALGKWGAFELNYSSDIDLMVIFDPDRVPVKDRDEVQAFCVRLTRDLAALLDRPTAEGYVFRTDLRLRPDPGAMPLAVSIKAAEVYYGSLGQNWERAAMIKARHVAGDKGTGDAFAAIMTAWIWRRNLDFAAIQDINSIKRQINAKVAHREKAENPFLGFNVKLGHGGIREIEFFAQTQQLIYGGREPALRAAATLDALAALAEAGHIDAVTRDELTAAYIFLRRVEHRLQMREDRQTHSLPDAQDEMDTLAAFLEYKTPGAFHEELKKHTGCVKKLYAGLFTESASLAGPGNLVFTGVEDDPETITTLKGMGFKEPERITAAVRGWHHGRYRAMRTEQARQILTELIPHLLETLSRTAHPDEAFRHFDAFLGRLPAGIPIFSMFAHNPKQMELVADIMGASGMMAEYLGDYPQTLEALLSKDLFSPLPGMGQLKAELERDLSMSRHYEDTLDIVRRFSRGKRFHAGVHVLRNLSDDAAVGAFFADITEVALNCLVPRVEAEFAGTYGRFKKGEFIIVGMGSLAARHMFPASDVDLVMLYDVPETEERSTGGEKSLPPSVYYIRLSQRVIAAVTAPTSEGILFDIDVRLRPHGEKGPLAASLESFVDYESRSAWAWEHMSLIRARVVYAKPETRRKVEAARQKVLSRKRDEKALRVELLDIREKVEQHFGSKDMWKLRYARGGMMDVMFVAHFLAMKSGRRVLFQPDVASCLKELHGHKLLSAKDYKALLRAQQLAMATKGFLHLCAAYPFKDEGATQGLKDALVERVTGKKGSFAKFTAELQKTYRESYAVFEKVFGVKKGR